MEQVLMTLIRRNTENINQTTSNKDEQRMDENTGFKYTEKTKVTNEFINETTGEQNDKSKN